jgi:uncharacterized protein YecE (DUF72 family)
VIGNVRIGISGWHYVGWRGVFYPPKLPQRSELAFAATNPTRLRSTYAPLPPATRILRTIGRRDADDFVFAVKGSRFITHMKKLRDVEDALATFLHKYCVSARSWVQCCGSSRPRSCRSMRMMSHSLVATLRSNLGRGHSSIF